MLNYLIGENKVDPKKTSSEFGYFFPLQMVITLVLTKDGGGLDINQEVYARNISF